MDYATLESEFFDINTLTVIANESYDSFARELQKEMVQSLSDRPVTVTVSLFKDRILTNKDGRKLVLDEQEAMEIIVDFRAKGYVDATFKITDVMINAIAKDQFEVPDKVIAFKEEIADMMIKIHETSVFKMANDDREIDIPKQILQTNQNFNKKEFQDLWNKIKVKTVYEVDFDSQELIQNSIKTINSSLTVKQVTIKITE
jgi:type III restriction enzyme